MSNLLTFPKGRPITMTLDARLAMAARLLAANTELHERRVQRGIERAGSYRLDANALRTALEVAGLRVACDGD